MPVTTVDWWRGNDRAPSAESVRTTTQPALSATAPGGTPLADDSLGGPAREGDGA